MTAYLLWLLLFGGLGVQLSGRPWLSVAAWYGMMCWECYDLHPDHVVAYSVVFLGPVVYNLSYRPIKVVMYGAKA